MAINRQCREAEATTSPILSPVDEEDKCIGETASDLSPRESHLVMKPPMSFKLTHNDACPTASVDPYITSAAERWELLTRFRQIQAGKYDIVALGSFSVAVFMTAPLPQLARLVDSAADITTPSKCFKLTGVLESGVYTMRRCM